MDLKVKFYSSNGGRSHQL